MKNQEKSKTVVATGTMSNLVGMWVYVITDDRKISRRGYVKGKADDHIFIVQWISGLTGEPNVCQLFSIEDLKKYVFIPDKETLDWVEDDYYKQGHFAFSTI